jgi:hypothetical protein
MKNHLIAPALRLFFFGSGTVIWIGIWLTGFATVHWLLYFPAVFFYFAAISGICPGIIISKIALPEKKEGQPKST